MMSGELSAHSLERPAPVSDLRVGPEVSSVAQADTPAVRRYKKSWREQRWERRRRRRWAEEVLGWILVPIILICGYWAVKAGLNALGTSPTALYQQIRAVAASRS